MDPATRAEAASQALQLEEDGWRALSSSGEAAVAFYDRTLDAEVTMLLPGGMRLTDRSTVVASMSGDPWTAYELESPEVHVLTAECAVVVYGVIAFRNDDAYSALVSSTYVRRNGEWRLACHQQTPR